MKVRATGSPPHEVAVASALVALAVIRLDAHLDQLEAEADDPVDDRRGDQHLQVLELGPALGPGGCILWGPLGATFVPPKKDSLSFVDTK